MTRDQIRDLQLALIAQGYPLPRWGADGYLGDETRSALESWVEQHSVMVRDIDDLAPMVLAESCPLVDLPRWVVDHRQDHAGRARRGRNPWSRIDTICLHQMACAGPGGWQRWRDLAIHYVILRDGTAAWLYDPDTLLWHGHSWNPRSVGLEIEGWYAGVEEDLSTLWVPQGASRGRRRSQALAPGQAEAALQAIHHAVAVVAAHGGRIRYVAAHRQSSATRQSDPGELIWREIALPAMDALGLKTAPTLSGGRPIPEAWDPAQVGVEY